MRHLNTKLCALVCWMNFFGSGKLMINIGGLRYQRIQTENDRLKSILSFITQS